MIPRRDRIFLCTKNILFGWLGLLFSSQQCGCSSSGSRCSPTVQTWVFRAKGGEATTRTGGWPQPVTAPLPPRFCHPLEQHWGWGGGDTINIHSRKEQALHSPTVLSLAAPESAQTVEAEHSSQSMQNQVGFTHVSSTSLLSNHSSH